MKLFSNQETYKSQIESVDFRHAEQIEKNVNDWVAQKTNGVIREILSAGSLNEHKILVLLNAVYFEGEWNKPIARSRSSLSRKSHVVLRCES